jgi:DNA-binding transcriptional LysR family regulator
MISSNALRYFAEVAYSGSIRGAAERLHVAPSAVSRQMALLEDELQTVLIERGRGRSAFRLTAAGEILLKHARTTDNELRRVQSDIEALKGMRKGNIRLGLPESLIQDFVPEFLVAFSSQFPGISYSVHVAGTPRLVEMLVADELDLCLTFNAAASADVTAVFERLLRINVLVARDHPLAERASLRLSDCADYGLALPDITLSAKRLYDAMFAKARIRPRTVLESNSYELLRSVSAAGLSIALLNSHLNFEPKPSDSFRYISLNDPRVPRQRFALCVRSGRNLPVAVLTFIEQIKVALENLASLKYPK